MQTEMSVEIERPIEEVFDYTVNNVAEWSVIVVEEEIINSTPEGVGSTFRIVTDDRGQRMEFDGVITRHEPPTGQTVVMKGKQFDIEADYRFDDLGGRTRVTQRSTVKGKGVVKVMFLLFGWLMRKSSCNALEKELACLKMLIETRA
jgi:hypothetical protein